MARRTLIWAWIAWVLLTFGAVASAYQVLFDIWMTAYPFANANE
jgi:TM2 domain-containing membrane protein YozV